MACIGCGLAVNADGTGRVDIDTKGGLTCVGGAGGTSNTAGTGLAIKKDTSKADNSVTLSTNGLYVPAVNRLEIYDEILSGTNLVGPASGGLSVSSGENKITLTNNTTVDKVYCWQASAEWSGVPGNTPGINAEIETKLGGGSWVRAAGAHFADGSWMVPFATRVYRTDVKAGQTVIIRAVFHVYEGTVSTYKLNLVAWGGYGNLL